MSGRGRATSRVTAATESMVAADHAWYASQMSGTTLVTVGDKGRIVVPSEIRAHRNWVAGTALVLVETEDGLLLTERATALRRIREHVAGAPLVGELLAERRTEAAAEDAAT